MNAQLSMGRVGYAPTHGVLLTSQVLCPPELGPLLSTAPTPTPPPPPKLVPPLTPASAGDALDAFSVSAASRVMA